MNSFKAILWAVKRRSKQVLGVIKRRIESQCQNAVDGAEDRMFYAPIYKTDHRQLGERGDSKVMYDEEFERKVEDIKRRVVKDWLRMFHFEEPAQQNTSKDADTEKTESVKDSVASLVSQYGYRRVADAFGVGIGQYLYEFYEYGKWERVFEFDDDFLMGNIDKLNIYKVYCRWRPWCPVLVSKSHMMKLKEYQQNVKQDEGDMFTLEVCHTELLPIIFRKGQYWGEMKKHRICVDFRPSHTEKWTKYSLNEKEFERLHVQYQSEKLKLLALEGIEKYHGDDWTWLKDYVLCHAQYESKFGKTMDVYVLSKAERAQIIGRLVDVIGREKTVKLFGAQELALAEIDLGTSVNEDSAEYQYYYLWRVGDRSHVFAILDDESGEYFLPAAQIGIDMKAYLP